MSESRQLTLYNFFKPIRTEPRDPLRKLAGIIYNMRASSHQDDTIRKLAGMVYNMNESDMAMLYLYLLIEIILLSLSSTAPSFEKGAKFFLASSIFMDTVGFLAICLAKMFPDESHMRLTR